MRNTDDDQDLKDERNDGEDEDQSVDQHLRWNIGPYPTVDWKVNQQRLHGLPDYSDFARHSVADRRPVGDAERGPVDDAYRMDTAWAPLAELIRLLPALVDLIYDCPAQFPPCLLQAIHDKLPGQVTRLHLRTFELRMLEGRFIPDSHELALIASPCIHSIWLQDHIVIGLGQRYADVLPGRQVQALEQMMKTEGLAPNLCDVRVTQIHQFQRVSLQNGPQTWLSAELVGTSRKQQEVTLRHLGLGGGSYRLGVTDAHVQHWNEAADLNALQTLELTGVVNEGGLDRLLSMSFPTLTALTFNCTEMPSLGYLDKVKRFIRGLPRLESLCVMAWDWSVASFADWIIGDGDSDGVAPNRTLRYLWLDHSEHLPTSSATSELEIARLGALYPRVETLSISIRRSKGDSDEVARYRALGAGFPRLRRLALTLEHPPPSGSEIVSFVANTMNQMQGPPSYMIAVAPWARPPPDGPWEGQIPRRWPYTNGHIVDIMAGRAVDATLARQVFAAVAAPGLETMILRALGGTVFPPQRPRTSRPHEDQLFRHDINPWLNGLAREWVVDTVNPTGEVKVKEIVGRADSWKRGGGQVPLRVHEGDLLWAHFRTLWPDTKEGSKGWFDDWESAPLAGMN
jgi:hypothetical protein